MSQEWSSAPSAPAPVRRRGKGAIITGAVLLALGVLLGIGGIIGVVGSATTLVQQFGDTYQTPNTFTQNLTAGTTYAVYEQTTGTTSRPGVTTVTAADITVTAPDGSTVRLDPPSKSMTQAFDGGDGVMVAVAQFDPQVTGLYTVDVTTDGAVVTVAPSFSSIGKAFAWVGLIVLGGLLALAGLITLIVGLVQRSSSKRATTAVAGGYPAAPTVGTGYAATPYATGVPAAAPPAPAPAAPPVAPPPGWYPDPGRPGGQRYWDGTAWTQHQA